MARFVTHVRKARFVYSPYTPQEMQGFAQILADSILGRIQRAETVYDSPASALKPGKAGRRGYPDYKAARGLKPVRDWTWTGMTLRCLKVLDVSANQARIGFLEDTLPGRRHSASQIAYYNNLRDRQWGVSLSDRSAVVTAMVNHERPLVTVQVKAA